jgi:hypothetical protein
VQGRRQESNLTGGCQISAARIFYTVDLIFPENPLTHPRLVQTDQRVVMNGYSARCGGYNAGQYNEDSRALCNRIRTGTGYVP